MDRLWSRVIVWFGYCVHGTCVLPTRDRRPVQCTLYKSSRSGRIPKHVLFARHRLHSSVKSVVTHRLMHGKSNRMTLLSSAVNDRETSSVNWLAIHRRDAFAVQRGSCVY